MAGIVHNNLPVFNGKRYDDWNVKMDAILDFQKIDKIVNKGFKESSNGDSKEVKKLHKENKKLDCKA